MKFKTKSYCFESLLGIVILCFSINEATAQSNTLYYCANSGTNTGQIAKTTLTGSSHSTKTILINNANLSSMGNERAIWVDYNSGFLYWCEGNSTNANWGVYRVSTSATFPATSATTIVNGFTGAAISPWGVAATGSTVYVMFSGSGQTDKIKKYTYAGSALDYNSAGTDVVTGIDVGRYIAVDFSVNPNLIYWSDLGPTNGRKVMRAPVNTTTAATSATSVNNPVLSHTVDDQPNELCIDDVNDRVYWVDVNINSGSGTGTASTSKICYVSTNATMPATPNVLYNAGTVYAWGMALDIQNQKIYYAENAGQTAGTNEIRRFSVSNPSGTVGDELTGLDAVKSIKLGFNTHLPVELLSFVATKEGRNVLLKWSTATELNNSHFEIERSTDGHEWEKIAKVKGAGNSSNIVSYNYTDFMVPDGFNTIYYRLVQVDFDGKNNNLPARAVDLKLPFGCALMDHPLNEVSQLSIQSGGNGTCLIQFRDIRGNLLVDDKMQVHEGENFYNLGYVTQTLQYGIYVLTVTSPQGEVITHKIVKK